MPTSIGRYQIVDRLGAGGMGVVYRAEHATLRRAAVYTVPTPNAVQISLFGGPTHFNVKKEMVSDVYFNQMFNLLGANIVDITRFDQQRVEGSAWGFNVGTDVASFFSRYIGVGGVIRFNRFNRGTVEIEKEPLTETPTELKAGHTMVGGGLRLRF